jgi:glycerol-3-phosphate O-acyltransferase/dihydroxyacetone phosphate acyltransferase
MNNECDRADVLGRLSKTQGRRLHRHLSGRWAIVAFVTGQLTAVASTGGSHDRTDLLPLKAGVAIMALGALQATPGLKVQIVPTGMSYFHPHKFRSRAVVEFGTPITIPQNLVDDFSQGGEKKREAIGKVLDLVVAGLRSVTVRAPDFETLMVRRERPLQARV